MPRRLLKSLPPAVIGLLVWTIIPDSIVERGFFHLTIRPFATSPYFVTPANSQHGGHVLRILRKSPPDLSGNLATNVVIGDDTDRVFQSSPPSPVDFAIILKNLRRLGKDSIAIGMPLSWENPDVISLAALEQQLASFSPAITSTPLSRRPLSSPLPPAFRRASVPLSGIRGDISGLPIVNHLSIPDAILGNDSSQAGFTILESETGTAYPNLIARWEDRVIFSFHFLAALRHFDASVSQTEIRMGEYVSISNGKAYIPIDEYGRLAIIPPALSDSESPSLPAETLIDAPDDFLKKSPFEPVLIRNGLSSSDTASTEFSEKLVSTVSMLSDPRGTSLARPSERLSPLIELLYLASIFSLIYGLGNYPRLKKKNTPVILASFLVGLHFLVIGCTSVWPPTLPAIALVLTTISLPHKKRREFRQPKSPPKENSEPPKPTTTLPQNQQTPTQNKSTPPRKKPKRRVGKKRRKK